MPRRHDPVAEYIKALRDGRNPSVDKILRQYPEEERGQLEEDLEGARLLFWASLSQVSESTLAKATERIKKARERASAAAALRRALHDIPPALGHTAAAVLQYLTANIGLHPISGSDRGQPAVQFRGGLAETSRVPMDALRIAQQKRIPKVVAGLLEAAVAEAPPVNLEEVSAIAGVSVTRVELDDYDGCTFQFDEGPVICLNAAMGNSLRERFTWAHELGHAVLHRERPQWCDTNDVIERAWAPSSVADEIDANTFAAELLLPRAMLKKAGFLDREFDFDFIEEVAERFQVSYTAAMVRFVKTTDTDVALFLVEGQQIAWGLRSESYRVRPRSGKVHHSSALALERPSDDEYYSDAPTAAWIGEDAWGRVDEMGLRIGDERWLVAVSPAEDQT